VFVKIINNILFKHLKKKKIASQDSMVSKILAIDGDSPSWKKYNNTQTSDKTIKENCTPHQINLDIHVLA